MTHYNTRKDMIKHNAFLHGYIEGIQSDGRVCDIELKALCEEMKVAVDRFPTLNSVRDLIEDIDTECFSDHDDILASLDDLKVELSRHKNWDANPHAYRNRMLGVLAGVKSDGLVLIMERTFVKEIAITLHHTDFIKQVASLNDEDFTRLTNLLVGNGYANDGSASLDTPAFFDTLEHDAIDIRDMKVVVSGTCEKYKRDELENMIVQKGGKLMSAVSGKTDCVFVMNNGSNHWTTTHFGTKIEKAIGLGVTLRSESSLVQSVSGAT